MIIIMMILIILILIFWILLFNACQLSIVNCQLSIVKEKKRIGRKIVIGLYKMAGR